MELADYLGILILTILNGYVITKIVKFLLLKINISLPIITFLISFLLNSVYFIAIKKPEIIVYSIPAFIFWFWKENKINDSRNPLTKIFRNKWFRRIATIFVFISMLSFTMAMFPIMKISDPYYVATIITAIFSTFLLMRRKKMDNNVQSNTKSASP